jgi:hypothetical protein
MAREWLYSHDGKEHGPVSTDQLKELAQTGALLPTDTVWTEGFTTWRRASNAKGLTFAIEPIVAPLPEAAPDAPVADVPMSQNQKNIEQLRAYALPKLQKSKAWFLRQPRWIQATLAFVLLGVIGGLMDHPSSQPWSKDLMRQIAEGEAALAKMTPAERKEMEERVHREVRKSLKHPPIWSEDKDGEPGHITKDWNPKTHRYEAP